jgi:hypothetical protein
MKRSFKDKKIHKIIYLIFQSYSNGKIDIHVSVHHNIIYENDQQHATV